MSKRKTDLYNNQRDITYIDQHFFLIWEAREITLKNTLELLFFKKSNPDKINILEYLVQDLPLIPNIFLHLNNIYL